MNHLTEEQLVDCYYGETEGMERHLQSCAACAAEYEKVRLTLDSVSQFPVPEPRPGFEADLWEAVRLEKGDRQPFSLVSKVTDQELPPAKKESVHIFRTLVLMGTIAAMLVVAFLAGRATKPAPKVAVERVPVLVVAVGDHMERLEAVFQELENENARNGKVDISFEQSSAEDLLDSNRLYRQTALASGDLATASVLEDMELALLEIAHQPGTLSPEQLTDLRNQISDRGVLFKAKVLGSRLRQEQLPRPESKETRL